MLKEQFSKHQVPSTKFKVQSTKYKAPSTKLRVSKFRPQPSKVKPINIVLVENEWCTEADLITNNSDLAQTAGIDLLITLF